MYKNSTENQIHTWPLQRLLDSSERDNINVEQLTLITLFWWKIKGKLVNVSSVSFSYFDTVASQVFQFVTHAATFTPACQNIRWSAYTFIDWDAKNSVGFSHCSKQISALSAMTAQAGLWILMASPSIINQGFVWINLRTWGRWELKMRIKLNVLNKINDTA